MEHLLFRFTQFPSILCCPQYLLLLFSPLLMCSMHGQVIRKPQVLNCKSTFKFLWQESSMSSQCLELMAVQSSPYQEPIEASNVIHSTTSKWIIKIKYQTWLCRIFFFIAMQPLWRFHGQFHYQTLIWLEGGGSLRLVD